MIDSWKIIKELETNNSRIFKENVIEKVALQDNDIFFIGCKLALDKLISFGVKQIPLSNKDGDGLKWNKFYELSQQLISREKTGNNARDLIFSLMKESTINEWNFWYRRILLKDLKCGTSEKTINNVVKRLSKDKYIIPVFSCMLAHDSNNHEKKLVGEKLVDYKLDGVRVITIYNFENKSISLFSRNGKELFNFNHISKLILKKLSHYFKESMVLDGEIVSESFQSLMKQVYNKSNNVSSDAKLALFDILPLSEFLIGKSILGCFDRHKILQNLLKNINSSSIFILEKISINFSNETDKLKFNEINKNALKKGYEGVMIKDMNAPYECKRSTFMLKSKPYIQVSLKVIGLEAGSGRNNGVLGALVCEGVDDGKKIITNVGSGLTDKNREEFWKNRHLIIGRIVEIRADAITQNQNTTDFSLRFPRFISFRGFEKDEKL